VQLFWQTDQAKDIFVLSHALVVCQKSQSSNFLDIKQTVVKVIFKNQ
jgi:hypothetical protein